MFGKYGQTHSLQGGYQARDKYSYHEVIADVLLGMYNALLINNDEKTFKLLAKLIFLRADRLLPNNHKNKGKIIKFKGNEILEGQYEKYDLSTFDKLTKEQIWVAMTEKQKEAGMVEVEIFKTNSLLNKLMEKGDIE